MPGWVQLLPSCSIFFLHVAEKCAGWKAEGGVLACPVHLFHLAACLLLFSAWITPSVLPCPCCLFSVRHLACCLLCAISPSSVLLRWTLAGRRCGSQRGTPFLFCGQTTCPHFIQYTAMRHVTPMHCRTACHAAASACPFHCMPPRNAAPHIFLDQFISLYLKQYHVSSCGSASHISFIIIIASSRAPSTKLVWLRYRT